MTELFIKIIGMSVTGSAVIAVIILLRLALKKAPKIFSYVLWAAALFRLLCPITFELPAAPIPSVEIPYEQVSPNAAEGLFITNTASESPADKYPPQQTEAVVQAEDTHESVTAPVSEVPAKKQINYLSAASYIWASAVIIMLLHGVISWARLSRSLRSAQKSGENVYVSAAISDPFIMGIIRPKIYLPTGLSFAESELIIRHEKAHMHRGDHIAKLVMYLTLCIHCFNPLVWVMFRLFERDMEMSCDEKVTADMTNEQKADYSQALLKISTVPAAVFTANFGEHSTKKRVRNVLSFKKPALWAVIVLTIVAAAVSIVLCANRKSDNKVTVPDIYALNHQEAERRLINAGLQYKVVFQNSLEPKYTVIKTEPAKSEKTDADTTIIVYVSSGNEDGSSIGNDTENVLALGINGIYGYMRSEDLYGTDNDKYEKHREILTDEDELKQYREQFYSLYGESVYNCTFYNEYIDVPLYDESGENIVDHFRKSDVIPVLSPDDEFYNWQENIPLIPLTEERQAALDISDFSPDMLYSDSKNCLFSDGAGGIYLYNFENKELMLAVDFLASMELANSYIADEANQYGGASIYSTDAFEFGKRIYFAFETKGKEKRGGEFNARYYYLDVQSSQLSMAGAVISSAEAAATEQTDTSEHPDAISELTAMINKRDYVYMVKSGLDDKHLPMIRLARNINGNVEYFDPFENGLISKEASAPEKWGLSFTAENANSEGVTVRLSRSCDEELTTGSYFTVQKKLIYGWTELSHSAEYYMSEQTWAGEALTIPRDGEFELYEDLSSIYVKLDPGYYRIGKYIGTGRGDDILLYAYFNVV